MLLHDKQKEIVASKARFKVIRAGRRGGKTALEVEDMVFEATGGKDRPIFYIAPTQVQARAIIWEALKSRVAGIGEANEQRLEMKLPTKDGGFSIIKIAGWENRENFRGQKAWKEYFDETDTMKDFFIGWEQIFLPALTDYSGHAMFCGTPKKENANLRRLEKMAEKDPMWQAFHFTTYDNPFIPAKEVERVKAEIDSDSFRQEYLAEYVENAGALFKFSALIDVFSNTITKDNNKYLIIDVSEDGYDKWVFSFWEGLEEYRRDEFAHMSSSDGRNKIREFAQQERIPFSHILVDAIGVGSNLPSEPLLEGIVGYKSSYAAIKTDTNIVLLPNVGYTKEAPLVSDYANLRSQCVFNLADHVNNHKIASRVTGQFKENIIDELPLYQDASKGDGKRFATPKEDVKAVLGHSPDHSDTWIMRMYFVVMGKMLPHQSEEASRVHNVQADRMAQTRANQIDNSNK